MTAKTVYLMRRYSFNRQVQTILYQSPQCLLSVWKIQIGTIAVKRDLVTKSREEANKVS